ncbi:MAG: hypothetical protein HQL01_12640 [Nitrospirae bacterium]|nr:hypothetical protein [Nitrospirota bacterium]
MQQSLPIVILNFNRLDPFLRLISWIQTLADVERIVVIDNASSYPPLLDYYAGNPDGLEIIRKQTNGGHLVTKQVLTAELNIQGRLIVTDPDLVPYSWTPSTILHKMQLLMDIYNNIHKIGAGLCVDDLPEHYPFAEEVRRHELSILGRELDDGSRIALIDTTFCLYRYPQALGDWRTPAIRTARPFMLQHVDWYVDPYMLSDEYAWYLDHCGASASYANQLKDWYRGKALHWHNLKA